MKHDPKKLEQLIINAILAGNVQFPAIFRYVREKCGKPYPSDRDVDKALQRLRKKGAVMCVRADVGCPYEWRVPG